ncbi:MAG: Gfo/Idh/MocA family oxidoreductase [Candidatus Abyssubacteria bacterium]|nr:Gfo/Idh/MocA family oxidoreductase [Candidatus Abyssubacteria bacterium]
MSKFKAGIIGTGLTAAAHVEGIRKSGLGEVTAIAGISEKAAEEKAGELGIDRAYGKYMDLIKDPDIQVVHNCTPNSLHFPISRAVLAANKHIVSEKPIAVDSREARLLLTAAERSKTVNAVMFNYRHHPVIAQFREMVQAGELGKIYAVHGSYLQNKFLYETDYDWSVDAETGGPSRVVADIGMHWCDLVQFITGLKITEVVADIQTFLPARKKSVSTVGTFGRAATPRHINVRVDTEDYGSILHRLQEGVRGALTLSQVSAGRKNRLFLQIDGSERSAAWDMEQPDALWLGQRDRPDQPAPKKVKPSKTKPLSLKRFSAERGEAWAIGAMNFLSKVYQYIADGKKPGRDPADFATFEDGYHAVVLTDGILSSARQKRWKKTSME